MFQNDLHRKNAIFVKFYFNKLQQVFSGFVSLFLLQMLWEIFKVVAFYFYHMFLN